MKKKITASDSSTGDRFGAQLDYDYNTIIVGAREDDDNGEGSGSAYIFERVDGAWKETKLLPSDGATGDIFGDVLAISGNIAIIGASGDDDLALNSGSAYVFERINGAWTEVAKLTPSDGMARDRFSKPAIDGNRVFIGSDRHDAVGENAGAVYVFERSEDGLWNEVAKLTAGDGMPGDLFGRYIDLDGDRAIIGALYGDGNTIDSGSAYIFEYQQGQWRQAAKLFPSDGETEQLFGRVVKISGDTAVVGSLADNQEQGAAYIFEQIGGEWQQTAKLTASDGEPGDRYGASVAIDDGIVVVASRQDDDRGIDSGSAYGYEKIDGVWTEIFKLLPSDGIAGDIFGKRLELNNNTLIIGAPFDDEGVPDSGSVYVYQLDRAGNRLREARRIGSVNIDSVPKTFADWVGPGDEKDFYRFYLPEPSEISLNLKGLSANGNLFLGDRRGQLLASSRQPGSESEQIVTTLEAGSYTVLVRGLSATNYNLSLAADFTDDSAESSLKNIIFETKLTASDGATNDTFGVQVAVDGNTTIIGTRNDDDNGESSGSVYIFEYAHGRWVETAKLTPSDGAAGDVFGEQVQIYGPRALIGADLDDNEKGFNAGAIYIFEQQDGTWIEVDKLTPSDEDSTRDAFGVSMAQTADGNTILVGADREDNIFGANAGSVYVFENLNGIWTETDRLFASDAETNTRFGRYVDVNGKTAIFGAVEGAPEPGFVGPGSAYIFEQIGGVWTQTAKLRASDGQPGSLFGRVTKIDGTTAVVGAPYDDESHGAAYIFEKIDGTWVETAKLTASDGQPKDSFGKSVAIADDLIVVSAPSDDDMGNSSGSVYLYEKLNGQWTEIRKLVAEDGEAGDFFGTRVNLDGNTLVVGAIKDEDIIPDTGSVYICRYPTSAVPIESNLDAPPKLVGLNYKVDGWSQIFLYNIELDELEQVSFDETNKSNGAVFWTSEEYNNELTMVVASSPNPEYRRGTKISFYRLIEDSWTEVNTFRPPTNLPYLHSVEPFDFDGISYVSYFTTDAQEFGLQENGEMWISRVDGSFHRKISASEYENNHEIIDPESFETEDTVFIYYTESLENGNRITHRAETGLRRVEGTVNSWQDSCNSDTDTLLGTDGDDCLVSKQEAEGNTMTDFEVGQEKGEDYVIFGSDSGFDSHLDLSQLPPNQGFVINGIREQDFLGISASSAGDLNGDDINDLITGASGIDPNGLNLAGEDYVV